MSNLLIVLLALLIGFIAGVIANLLADYLPARRLHHEASTSPFASRDLIPPQPHLIPRVAGTNHPLPFYLCSGLIGRLIGRGDLEESLFIGAHWPRRIIVEVLMPIAFAWIVSRYPNFRDWLFLLACLPFLVLIAVIDIEYRWVLSITWFPLVVFAIIDYGLTWRVPPVVALRGVVTLFAIGLFLYLLGVLVQRRRRIGRTVFGFGDVWLMAVSGLLVGWPIAGLALLITIFLAGVGSIAAIVENRLHRQRRRRQLAIPYAPYLMIGTVIMMYAPWLATTSLLFWINHVRS